MSFVNGGGGRNPAFGRDTGAPPPTTNNRQAYSGYNYGYPHPYASGYFGHQAFYPTPQQLLYWGTGTTYSSSPLVTMNGQPAFAPGIQQQPSSRPPTAQPVLNSAMPAANMTNSTGGVGCEPGYNYFFPAEHTKILIFRTGNTAPWQLPANFATPFHAVHVPTGTTIGELLRGFGATNPDPSKNKVIEVHQGGNGRWYKGMSFKGDDDKSTESTIKSVGWDATRTGLPGGKPVVYLYVTKG